MKTFEINGKEYNAAEFDFNLTCELEDNGVSLSDIRKKPMSFIRSYVALSAGVDVDIAGKEIEAHITNGGKLDDVMNVMMEQINDSDFFRNLATEPEAKASRKKVATT